MKHSFFFLAVVFISTTVHAQLVVDSLGKAAFATTTNSTYQINVLGSKSGINCTSGSGSTTGTIAINALAYQKNYSETIGVKGTVSSQGTGGGFSIGVYGLANCSTSGKNIGLYGGIIPQYDGAGLYASSSSYNGLHALSSRYAGYFEGDTYVDGGLTVNGVLVSSSSQQSSGSTLLRQNEISGQTIAGQLRQLEPATFYVEAKKTPQAVNVSIDGLSLEEAVALPKDIPMSLLERQVQSKQHYGLDADQLEEVFPDLVYDNEGGTKSINYVEMVPILIQAINELSAKVEALESGKDVKKAKKATGLNEKAESVQVMSLGQNKPNPFSTTTEVEVTVPESVQHAFVYVYDLNGKKVQQVDVTARGKQTVQLNAAILEEGMYLYSLIADGQVVQTRRMIIEK